MERYWIALLFVLALTLRVVGVSNHGLWHDERLSVAYAHGVDLAALWPPTNASTESIFSRNDTAGVAAATARSGGNALLHNLLLHQVFGAFGVTEATARLSSVLFGALTVPLLFVFCVLIGIARREALLASGLLAVHPLALRYAQEARAYELATFLGLAASILFVLTVRGRSWQAQIFSGIAYGICSAALILSHYLGVTVLLAHVFWALLTLRQRRAWLGPLLGALVCAALCGPWIAGRGLDQSGRMGKVVDSYRTLASNPATSNSFLLPATAPNLAKGITQQFDGLNGSRLREFGLRLRHLVPLYLLLIWIWILGIRQLSKSIGVTSSLVGALALAPVFLCLLISVKSGHTVFQQVLYVNFGVPAACVVLAEAVLAPGATAMRQRFLAGAIGALWLVSAYTGYKGVGREPQQVRLSAAARYLVAEEANISYIAYSDPAKGVALNAFAGVEISLDHRLEAAIPFDSVCAHRRIGPEHCMRISP